MLTFLLIVMTLPAYLLLNIISEIGIVLFSEDLRGKLLFLVDNYWIFGIVGLILWIFFFRFLYNLFIKKLAHSIEERYFKK